MLGTLGLFMILVHLVLVQSRDFEGYQALQISFSPSPSPEPTAFPCERSKPNESASVMYYNVKSFGAIGDGVSDDTQAFKMAWDAACQARKSSLLIVPRGSSFMIQSTIFTGPCRNTITLQIDGTIMPPDGPDLWPMSSKRQWLVFYRISGMSVQGGGLIDGRGEKWWKLPCKPHRGVKGTTIAGPCDSPAMMRFFMSSNITVRGLRVRNSPQFHFRFDGCQKVHIDSISINSPRSSPNTDGIHIENTNSVKIQNLVISTGDDCVSIGAGCYNVDIRNITCGPSHGIRYNSSINIT
uniref:Polygalacturonase n=1 Tax=Kalanchoe fedtschenkoi TaxID=63787 RepID=A0A7N0TF10_KALFE